jgi:excinuclease UvrABC nuclease subunit
LDFLLKSFKLKAEQYLSKGIYYLYFEHKIVYVGKSVTNAMERVCRHYRELDKQFDEFLILPFPNVSDRQLLSIEAKFIRKYSPKYNIVHKKCKQKSVYMISK